MQISRPMNQRTQKGNNTQQQPSGCNSMGKNQMSSFYINKFQRRSTMSNPVWHWPIVGALKWQFTKVIQPKCSFFRPKRPFLASSKIKKDNMDEYKHSCEHCHKMFKTKGHKKAHVENVHLRWKFWSTWCRSQGIRLVTFYSINFGMTFECSKWIKFNIRSLWHRRWQP